MNSVVGIANKGRVSKVESRCFTLPYLRFWETPIGIILSTDLLQILEQGKGKVKILLTYFTLLKVFSKVETETNMPTHKIKCNLCFEDVFSNGLGHHLLSKSHRNDLKTEDNMKRLSAYHSFLSGEADHGFKDGIGNPPLFKLGKHAYNLCLCCKKAFISEESKAHDIMTLEYITNHYKQHPECKEALKADLEKFISGKKPKKAVAAVNSAETSALKSENDELKKEVEKLKATLKRVQNELAMNETSVEQLTEENDLYHSFVKKAFGRGEIHDLMSCLEDMMGDSTLTPFNL